MDGIQRLQSLNTLMGDEMEEVDELLSQLLIQVELVRFSSETGENSRALMGELLWRVEGLAQMLDDQDGSKAARAIGTLGQ